MTCQRCGAPIPTREGRGRPRKYCDIHYGRAGCVKQRCSRTATRPGGLCAYHHRRALKSQPAWTMRDELLDWLSLEGTWATALEAAERFDRNLHAVERTLRKLRDEGLVESRVMELARTTDGGYERRTEWRIS